MREIKFRGKRIDNDEWIYGYLLYDYNIDDDYVPFIIWKDGRYLGGSGEEQIIEHTIGQYTGLHDKNGKEIYEGDIMPFTMIDGRTENYHIVFRDGEFDAINKQDTNFIWRELWKESTVIGNIYDNPELLEGKEE